MDINRNVLMSYDNYVWFRLNDLFFFLFICPSIMLWMIKRYLKFVSFILLLCKGINGAKWVELSKNNEKWESYILIYMPKMPGKGIQKL